MEEVKPYSDIDQRKKQQVTQMFDSIAPKYDALNHILSFGIDKLWRKKAVKIIKKQNPEKVLDIATGTGDFAFSMANSGINNIIGADLSNEMIQVAISKASKNENYKGVSFQIADAENIPFSNNSFDVVTVAFGVRNFENLKLGLSEMLRVLNNDGIAVIIEFSKPQFFLFKAIYNLYFKYLVPFIGKIISKDKKAYKYLYNSVDKFPYGKDFLNILQEVGFRNNKSISLSFGIANIYIAKK